MKFQISHRDLIRAELERFGEYCAERRSPAGIENSEEPVFPSFGFGASAINLPYPLESVGMNLRAVAGFYCMSVYILGKNSFAYGKNFSAEFSDALGQMKEREGKELIWSPINERGRGYLLNERTCLISIGGFSTEKSAGIGRVISLGDCGAEPRKVEERTEEFEGFMSLLESVSTLYVNSVYAGRKKNKFALPRDLVLHLNLIA